MKKKNCISWMRANPPKNGEIGYYERVAKKFGYKNGEVVRDMAKNAGIRNARVNVQAKRSNGTLDKAIYAYLRGVKDDTPLETLSDHFDCGVSKVKKAVEKLHAEGKNVRVTTQGISLSGEIPKSTPTVIDHKHLVGQVIKFGVTGDNHLCSKYARLDVLNALYDIYAEEGVTTVYNTGNMIDGEARFNKFDICAYGIEAQTDYFIQNFPKRKGITTYFITGDDHEGWYTQREGIDVGRFIQLKAVKAGRSDLVYLGHMEHDIVLKQKRGEAILRLVHAGGGSSYATSYTAQKIVESYQGGEKPQILLIGHYHKAEYGFPREVHCVQTGCTEDQTPFMRKKKIQAHVGGWLVEMQQGENGIIQRFKPEWIPFFDKGFYSKAWKYNWKT